MILVAFEKLATGAIMAATVHPEFGEAQPLVRNLNLGAWRPYESLAAIRWLVRSFGD